MQPWQFAVPVTTLFTLSMNVLANLLPMAGRTTAEISDGFPALFTPAGYVFSIWGLIYTLLLGYSVYQSLPGSASNPRLRAIAAPIAIGSVANGIWIALWHHLWIGTSVLATLALLITLAVAHRRLRSSRGAPPPSFAERLWARGLVSIYLGWASVATVANITVFLYQRGFVERFLLLPAAAWGALAVVVASTLGVLMLQRHRDAPYAAVLVWAFVGIVVAQRETLLVALVAALAALALGLLALSTLRATPKGVA